MTTMTDAEKKFLEGLTKLTLETGVVIGGCGCCGSPFLDDAKSLRAKRVTGGEYTYGDSVEFVGKDGGE